MPASTPPTRYRLGSKIAILLLLSLTSSLPAQQSQPADDNVIIDVPEQVELRVLVDFVGKALDLRFAHGTDLSNQKVELRPSPITLPKAHLLQLLGSLLRVHDLVMVEESAGFYRIIRADQTTRSVPTILPQDQSPSSQSMRVVTHVMSVPTAGGQNIAEKLKDFLSSQRAGLLSIPERGIVVITDYESRIALIKELLDTLSRETHSVEVRRVNVDVGSAAALATQVSAVLQETHRRTKSSAAPGIVRADILPGELVVIGTKGQADEAERLIRQLSPSTRDLETRTFAPKYLSVDRLQMLIEKFVLAPGSRLTQPAALEKDPQGGRLFVTAEAATLNAIADTLSREDQPLPESERPLRIYRPQHRTASELLMTLGQLLAEHVQAPANGAGPQRGPTGASGIPQAALSPGSATAADTPIPRVVSRVQGADYVLTEDAHTNSILAIGTREFHAQVESLIGRLDRRRPQVMIEMTLIAVTTSDSMDLGVELEKIEFGGGFDYLTFSNFGLSTIDVATGERTLTPGFGGNGILVKPGEFSMIVRALATSGNAHVISTPKLLVADNTSATLRNVDEAPFTSVNASDTVATTSFAGFESAGTTLTVTPHISEGDQVTLEYELTFSNFSGGSSTATVPPPRTTNSFNSTVEVPDGHVIITGGLVVNNDTDSLSEVPLFGRLPLVGPLFQSRTNQNTKTRIYAFIRPRILRDDASLDEVTQTGIETAERADPEVCGEAIWSKIK